MSPTDNDPGFFECVDPAVGDLVWRYSEPDLDPALRRKLTDHVAICDACRWDLGLEQAVLSGLQDRTLQVDPPRQGLFSPFRHRRRAAARSLRAAGGLALAASLALMLLLSPSAPDGDLVDRGGDDLLRILRPVESEVVFQTGPRIVWTPLPDAVRYKVTLRQAGGSFAWIDSTSATEIRVPRNASLPRRARIRAFVEPFPPDLAPPRGVSVSFRTGSPAAFFLYRLGAAPPPVRLLAVVGLGLLAAGVMSAWLLRRP